jgi:ribosomal protein S20
MVEEENTIGISQNQNNVNQQLTTHLKTLSKEYQHQFNKMQSDGKNEALSNIYDLIISINDIPMLKEQVDAITKYQELLLKSKEHDIDVQKARL